MQTSPQQSPPGAFDPASPGCSEAWWQASLTHVASWSPPAAPLLVVSPHPDDEVFGAGGLIRQCQAQGHPVTVVSVTDGEAAYPDWNGLHRVRRQELDDALRVLCQGPISLVRLGLPDGQVREHVIALFSGLESLVGNRPTLVAPYEFDGHPDHDVTGAVCCELARLHRLPLLRYPIWAWHQGTPDTFPEKSWRRFELDADSREAKAAAIRCFASQLQPVNRAPIVPVHVLPYFSRSFEAFLI